MKTVLVVGRILSQKRASCKQTESNLSFRRETFSEWWEQWNLHPSGRDLRALTTISGPPGFATNWGGLSMPRARQKIVSPLFARAKSAACEANVKLARSCPQTAALWIHEVEEGLANLQQKQNHEAKGRFLLCREKVEMGSEITAVIAIVTKSLDQNLKTKEESMPSPRPKEIRFEMESKIIPVK